MRASTASVARTGRARLTAALLAGLALCAPAVVAQTWPGKPIRLVVGTGPAGNTAELVQLARAQPGKLKYGSAGIGSPAHLAGELLGVLAGVSMAHVPYKGAAQALNEVVGGRLI